MNHTVFGGFKKNEYFLGYEDIVDIFFFLGGGDHHKIGLYLGVISMYFKVFLNKVKVQKGGYFLG